MKLLLIPAEHRRRLQSGACLVFGLIVLVYCQVSPALTDEKDDQSADDYYAARLYVGTNVGAEMKPLVSQEGFSTQGSPDWCDDGSRIAFDTWDPKGGESGSKAVITVVDADGENPRILGDGSMPSFSPGGHRIAFSRYKERGVWVMSSEGPEELLVLIDENGWGADWSPDGTRIAYTTTQNGPNIIVYSLVEGTHLRLFAENENPYRHFYWNFAWSGDSKQIVFRGIRKAGGSEVAIVNASGANHGLKTIFTGESLPAMAWSPDSKTILLTIRNPKESNRWQLHAIDATDPQEPKRLPGQVLGGQFTDMAYSPDGKRIAVTTVLPKK